MAALAVAVQVAWVSYVTVVNLALKQARASRSEAGVEPSDEGLKED